MPLGFPRAFPGPPGAPRRPPAPKTNQSKKTINKRELTEQWSPGARDENWISKPEASKRDAGVLIWVPEGNLPGFLGVNF